MREKGGAIPLSRQLCHEIKRRPLLFLLLLHLHSILNPNRPSLDANVAGNRRTSEDYEQELVQVQEDEKD